MVHLPQKQWIRKGVGIAAQGVYLKHLDVPQCRITQVRRGQRMRLIKIGHRSRKPTVLKGLFILRQGMWIGQGGKPKIRIGNAAVRIEMHHAGIRQIAVQIMLDAPMIVHDIHDVLHLSLMKFCSQFPQRIIPTVPRIYAIMVRDGISVVAVARHVVF